MRIINETQWDTRDLRRVFALVLAKWNREDDRKVPSKRLKRVKVVHTRTHISVSGCAYLNSGWMQLRLPPPGGVWRWKGVATEVDGKTVVKSERVKEQITLDVATVGWLFEHELAHCAGYHHDRMGPLNHHVTAKSGRYAYLDGIVIRPKAPAKKKAKVDQRLVRQARAQAALKRWTTKLRRATTEVKKAKRTLRYYERTLASSPAREAGRGQE